MFEKKMIFLFFLFFGPFLVLGPLQKRVNAPNMGVILKKKIGIRFHIKFKENSQNFMPIGLKIKKLLKENQQGGHIVPPPVGIGLN